MQRHAHQTGDTEHNANPRGIAQGRRLKREIASECWQERQTFLLIRHQVAGIQRALGAQHAGNAAEVPGGKLADRVIRMLTSNFLQRAELFIHVKARGVAVIENVVRQHPQARGDGLRIPADHRLGVAALDQLLHLLWVMKAHGDMLLQIQPHRKVRSRRLYS